ncbi:MAG: glutamate racemase [Bacteroidetes bacterium]|nr:glutamate racemase [Bacteroidota bacterium]
MDRERPIGIFDSGIGGLTVVKRLAATLPNENLIYFGDTARVPYGSKSNSTVIEYALQDAKFLTTKNVKAIVVACNTASSVAISVLKDKYEIPIIGMIEPGTEFALKTTRNKKIGIIGTRTTTDNKAYSKALKKADKNINVFEKACPLFVPLAEEGWTKHKATYKIAEEYLAELREQNIDTLILGCTHYPILAEVIQEVIGKNVKLIDSGIAAAELVRTEIERIGLLNNSNSLGNREFYVTDIPKKFKEIAELFLSSPVKEVRKVELEDILR